MQLGSVAYLSDMCSKAWTIHLCMYLKASPCLGPCIALRACRSGNRVAASTRQARGEGLLIGYAGLLTERTFTLEKKLPSNVKQGRARENTPQLLRAQFQFRVGWKTCLLLC